MKRPLTLLLSLVSLCLGACQFFAPAANEQTLVAQNQALNTEIAAVRLTATVDADRLQVTLEYVQTAINHVDSQTQALQATMIAQGTPAAAIDLGAITPDIPLTLTTPAPILQVNGGAPITPISITPGSAGAAPPLQLAPATPGADVSASSDSASAGGATLTNVVTAERVGSDDCALGTSTAFTTATSEIYVVATAINLTPRDTVTSRWSANGSEVVSYDWSPSFDIARACIWFYIDQNDVTFTSGDWRVQLEINGQPAGSPAAFSIASTTADGDAQLQDAMSGSG